MIVELARRVSSCGWVALCERRRAGFARLSGWQPVGNWVASGANFPASLLPVGVIPTTSRESRCTVCVGKWPRSQAERDPAYRRKAETIPRGGASFSPPPPTLRLISLFHLTGAWGIIPLTATPTCATTSTGNGSRRSYRADRSASAYGMNADFEDVFSPAA